MRARQPTPHADHVGSLWSRLASRAGGMPARRDLDPAAIGQALPWSITLDRIAPTVTRMRVGGVHVATLLGTDPAGVPLSALVDADSRAMLAAAVRHLFEAAAPVRLDVGLPRNGLRAGITGALSFWPLADEAGAPSGAIGSLDLPQPPRCEVRLTLQAWTAAPSVFAPVPHRPVAAAGRGRPFLRLVVAND